MRASLLHRAFRVFSISIAMSGANAAVARPSFITVSEAMDAPKGFVEMCGRDSTFCSASDGGGDAALVTGAIVRRPAPIVAPDPQRWFSGPLTVLPPSWMRAAALPGGDGTCSDAFAIVAPLNLFVPSPRCDAYKFIRSVVRAAPADARAVTTTAMATPAATLRDERQLSKLLSTVNGAVNRRVVQISDSDQFGVPEQWQRTGTGKGVAGDCEDLAIEKRIELIEAGFPSDRLFFAIVYAPKVGLHTVLVARMPKGDMVLDSRTSTIWSWQRVSYTWLGAQSIAEPMVWRRVEPSRRDHA